MLVDFRQIIQTFRLRKRARELRREQTREWVQNLLDRSEMGILRSKLVAKWRKDPRDVPVCEIPLDRDGISMLASYCLAKGEDPRPSLESLAPGK